MSQRWINSLPGCLFSKMAAVKVDNFVKPDERELQFDIFGIDPAILNSVRRVIMSEVATVAIERVLVANNTSVIPDEVLAHRLGLIPIFVNPKRLKMLPEHAELDAKNHLKFHLKVDAGEKLSVLSDDIKWIPLENQEQEIGPVTLEKGIILVKLAPGQQLDMDLIATKGIGQEHAKWNPASCAMYKHLLKISLKKNLKDEEVRKVQEFFSPGVIGIDSKGVAAVINPKLCNQSPEYLRGSEVTDLVQIERLAEQFNFCIETTGFYLPADLFVESLQVLRRKCTRLYETL